MSSATATKSKGTKKTGSKANAKPKGKAPAKPAATVTVTAEPTPVVVAKPEKVEPKAGPKAAPKAKAKPAADAKPKAMSCLDAAAVVLRANRDPMPVRAMIDVMKGKGLWASDAATPWATLYSAILREINVKKAQSRFAKADRGLFTINAKAEA